MSEGKFKAGIFGIVLLAISVIFVLPGFYVIQTGNVGVETYLGTVNKTEITDGLHWRFWLTTSIKEYSSKVITVDLDNMTPKADDNLSLQQLDITVWYKVTPSEIAELVIDYASTSVQGNEGEWYPGYELLYREARDAIYKAVAEIDSLELHRNRKVLANDVREKLQQRMNDKKDDVFFIDRVATRALDTDSSIEEAIQLKVKSEKELEAKSIQVEIAKKDAQIRREEAHGIADANGIINKSLTPAYLQHEINKALQSFADNGNNTVVIPANMEGFQMIMDQQRLGDSPK